jgi:glycosyltransferase involved in cell wall biosynthesis
MGQPVRILHILGNTQLGGAESRIMDLYRHMDRSVVQFDFVVHSKEEGYFNEEIRKLGGRIFRVPRFRVLNYFSYCRAWKKLLQEHRDADGRSEFHMIQGHMTSTAAIYLPIARKCGIETTIAHARSAGVDKGLKGILTRFLRRNLSKKADYLFTCSELAGISVFGKKAVEQGRTRFLPNAIDCQKFAPDPLVREKIRRELGIEKCYVIGHVGRFHYAKNHEYLLRVFAELVKRKTRDYVLLLLGEGSGMEDIRILSRELGIGDKVYFLGNKSNVNDYYQAMDYFVYPSRFEGMPGTIVEAQTAGLRCLMSDTICKEVIATELVTTRSIREDPGLWADEIEQHLQYQRSSRVDEMKELGFDVHGQAVLMTDFYTKEKLLLISPMLHQGGFERVCITTARLLKPYYDVSIVIFDDADIAFDIRGLSIINIHLGVRNGKLAKITNLMRRAVRVRKLKQRMKPVIAYSFGPSANMVNALSKTSLTSVFLGLRGYQDVADDPKMKLYVRKADRIICCSKEIEAIVQEKYGYLQTATLYNPYDAEGITELSKEKVTDLPWKMEDEDRPRILIGVGRDDPIKGFWHLIKAFYLVQKEIPQMRLIIMGDGSFEQAKSLVSELQLEQKVYFPGVRKNPYKYLAASEMFLLSSYTEGFPNVLVEAMILGRPLISTDCRTGPAEILDHGKYGILVPDMGDTEDYSGDTISEKETCFAEKIVEVLKDSERQKELSELERKRAGEFDYDSYVDNLLKLCYNKSL